MAEKTVEEMEARLKQVYPELYAHHWGVYQDGEEGWTIRTHGRVGVAYGRLGFGSTLDEAIKDAYAKLPSSSEGAQEPAEQSAKIEVREEELPRLSAQEMDDLQRVAAEIDHDYDCDDSGCMVCVAARGATAALKVLALAERNKRARAMKNERLRGR